LRAFHSPAQGGEPPWVSGKGKTKGKRKEGDLSHQFATYWAHVSSGRYFFTPFFPNIIPHHAIGGY